MNTRKLALLLLVAIAVPVVAQSTIDRTFEMTRNIASSVIGLSPQGAETYARHVVASRSSEQFKALTGLDMQVGEELAREKPDRKRLHLLVEAIAAEEASLARRERQKTITTAFLLSNSDRRLFGQMIVRTHKAGLADQKPVTRLLP
jgi:hypothetical protein